MMNAAPSAALAAAWFAVDPVGLGGVVLRGSPGPERERWLQRLKALLPPETPWRRLPTHIADDRLLGGLDLAASLQAGRPIAQRGLLAQADAGIVLVAMAERMSASTAASVAAVLDSHELVVERHGIGTRSPSRIGVVALDEGLDDDERPPARLQERLAFRVTTGTGGGVDDSDAAIYASADIIAARSRLADTTIDASLVERLCAASIGLGVDSVRAALFACRAARVAAALDRRSKVTEDDAALAAALVLAPRATRLPPRAAPDDGRDADTAEQDAAPSSAPNDAEPSPRDHDDADAAAVEAGSADDIVLDAAVAAIPRGLLASMASGGERQRVRGGSGRAGALQRGTSRGRPTGACRGEPRGGARLNLIETLRAAAPWQALRRREADAAGPGRSARLHVRREDLHVWRLKQRSETTTLFVVDASGSSALHRLAEAKGAVELLLADCYVRRDSVAVMAFRGAAAELLLPPTRSLVRAKRSLAGLPGGGGTPLAAGIASAHALAEGIRRRGATPVVVLLTDGRANIALDGTPGRARANAEALAAARQMRHDGYATLLLDTSPQPQEPARELAAALGARYLPLPHAGAQRLSEAVRAAASA